MSEFETAEQRYDRCIETIEMIGKAAANLAGLGLYTDVEYKHLQEVSLTLVRAARLLDPARYAEYYSETLKGYSETIQKITKQDTYTMNMNTTGNYL